MREGFVRPGITMYKQKIVCAWNLTIDGKDVTMPANPGKTAPVNAPPHLTEK